MKWNLQNFNKKEFKEILKVSNIMFMGCKFNIKIFMYI